MKKRDKYTLSVSRNVLIILAGLVWLGVGIMLLRLGFLWLFAIQDINIFYYVIPGVVLGLLIRYFGFLKIVNKNLKRISGMKEMNCIFAFIPWSSYLIIGIMITLGINLRHSAFPKQYLSIIYISIGSALALSSLRYIKIFYHELMKS